MAKKYPTNSISVDVVITEYVENILSTPINDRKINNMDMIVPTARIERYKKPLLFFI